MESLKELKAKHKKDKIECDKALERSKEASRLYSKLHKELLELESIIDKHGKELNIGVTDHAITRYLERVEGLDTSRIKDLLISEDLINMVKVLGGSGKFPLGEHHIVMKDYVIVTII